MGKTKLALLGNTLHNEAFFLYFSIKLKTIKIYVFLVLESKSLLLLLPEIIFYEIRHFHKL